MTRVKGERAARNGVWANWGFLAGLGLFLAAGQSAAAAETETREFALSVDGKRAGDMRLTIAPKDHGVFVISCQANVKVRYLVYVYTYSFQGTETWQGHRLVRLESTTNDNGKALAVTAVADGSNLRVTGNGQDRMSRPDVWTTSYWRLPEAKFRNGPIPLLDSDTGRSIAGRMQYLGSNQITVAGQVQTCPHYRVTGDKLQVDVWYDAQERLIRQESIEDGHRTLFELSSLRRAQP